MTTSTLVKKLGGDIKELKSDLRQMKQFLFAPLNDAEGEYKDAFVKKMLSRSQNQAPFYRFTDGVSFLNHVGSKK